MSEGLVSLPPFPNTDCKVNKYELNALGAYTFLMINHPVANKVYDLR